MHRQSAFPRRILNLLLEAWSYFWWRASMLPAQMREPEGEVIVISPVRFYLVIAYQKWMMPFQ